MTAAVKERLARHKCRAVDALERIDTLDEWTLLNARPGHHTVARTETVKWSTTVCPCARLWVDKSVLFSA